MIIAPPQVAILMPQVTKRYVEMYCDHPLATKLPPLMVNMAFLLVTSGLAFKTRNLPENFNESRFIFFQVSGTLILWIAFISLYFLTTFAAQKVLLLSLTGIANASTVLMCLFLPKVYALFYVKDEKMKLAQFSYSNQSISHANISQPRTYTQTPTAKVSHK